MSTKIVYEPVGRKIINKAGPDREKRADAESKIITQTSDISLRAEEPPLLLFSRLVFYFAQTEKRRKIFRDDEYY